MLQSKRSGSTQRGVREANILGEARTGNGEHHVSERDPTADVPIHPGGGRIRTAKERLWFPQIYYLGRANVRTEMFLYAFAFNVKKYWMKREHGRLQTRVSEKMTA